MNLSYSYSFIILCIINIKSATCTCSKSFAMTCDDMQDVVAVPKSKKSQWRELDIQSDKYENTATYYTLKREHTRYLDNLERIVIQQQLNNVEPYSLTFNEKDENKHIILYGNNIGTLTEAMFSDVRAKILGLENNGIKEIGWSAFTGIKANTIDLSYNHLTVLKVQIFSPGNVSKFILRHNKLSRIERDSLPLDIKSLYLDYNEFELLPITSLRPTLEELSLSHNKLSHIGSLSQLQNLKKLDISFNHIFAISNAFNGLKKLRVLNLQNNNLLDFIFPSFLKEESKEQFCLSIAFNRLINLHFEPFQRKITKLVLRGNPWNCGCFNEMAKSMQNLSVSYVNQCETELLGSGKYPFCVVSTFPSSMDDKCIEEEVSEEYLDFFQKHIQNDICDDEDEYLLSNCPNTEGP